MRSSAIMQPTYLPWAGYFGLMASVDVFVSLDDVQFERRSWQSRNRILLHGKDHTLTVPTRKVARDTPIRLIEVDPEQDWRAHHLEVLSHAYARHPYGRPILDLIAQTFAARHTHLADLNIALIKALAEHIGISVPIVRASELGCGGQRSDHLAAICQAVGSTAYVSPAGSKEYMEEDKFEQRHGIRASFQRFDPPPYRQLGVDGFVSHLSIVDVIAHNGPEFARAYISPESRD